MPTKNRLRESAASTPGCGVQQQVATIYVIPHRARVPVAISPTEDILAPIRRPTCVVDGP